MTDARTHGRAGAQGPRDSVTRRHALLGASVRLCLCASCLLTACRRSPSPSAQGATRENDVPVAVNSESPFQYPPDLYDQGVEGEVRLRLYVDSTGRVYPESTRVATSSGTPGLDSAAIKGAAQLQFAPAHRNGEPVGMAFYQPVIFRRIGGQPAAAPR